MSTITPAPTTTEGTTLTEIFVAGVGHVGQIFVDGIGALSGRWNDDGTFDEGAVVDGIGFVEGRHIEGVGFVDGVEVEGVGFVEGHHVEGVGFVEGRYVEGAGFVTDDTSYDNPFTDAVDGPAELDWAAEDLCGVDLLPEEDVCLDGPGPLPEDELWPEDACVDGPDLDWAPELPIVDETDGGRILNGEWIGSEADVPFEGGVYLEGVGLVGNVYVEGAGLVKGTYVEGIGFVEGWTADGESFTPGRYIEGLGWVDGSYVEGVGFVEGHYVEGVGYVEGRYVEGVGFVDDHGVDVWDDDVCVDGPAEVWVEEPDVCLDGPVFDEPDVCLDGPVFDEPDVCIDGPADVWNEDPAIAEPDLEEGEIIACPAPAPELEPDGNGPTCLLVDEEICFEPTVEPMTDDLLDDMEPAEVALDDVELGC